MNIKFEDYNHLFKEIKIPAKTILLREGEVSKKAYFVKQGCLRLWFNSSGKDITFQFFFENEAVSSSDSFRLRQPSLFTLESVEPTTLLVITKNNYDILEKEVPGYKDFLLETLFKRVAHYQQLFLSRIRDNPRKRYHDLLKNNPRIIQRVPQQYIASYLGITAVSLSRIRKKSQNQNFLDIG
jgi:CRP-like cAMP-binding protein